MTLEEREQYIEAGKRAGEAMHEASLTRTWFMWATVVNGLVCLAIAYDWLPAKTAAASGIVWALYAVRAVLRYREAGKALTELNRMNRELVP